ncbi:hypothetical protein JZ751_028678 [Albula glossodonta]|uniref:Uncharacterized protein n=1 Tax=Albula glossodonta TaxID=121402 RepID=A0A8T2NM54_9TELE|nr:hypothetical protein JZ751_028678 [Albula glossodonta]
MSAKVDLEVLAMGRDNPAAEAPETLPANESPAQKPHPQATTTLIVPATAHAVEKGGLSHGALDMAKESCDPQSATLLPQVGGTCSIVHVLEWKEGVALLPGSNLKFRMRECGTLEVVNDEKVTCIDPAAGGAVGKQGIDKRPEQKTGTIKVRMKFAIKNSGKMQKSYKFCLLPLILIVNFHFVNCQ